LTGYTLDTVHFEALSASIEQTQKPVINSVYLDNCGVDDEELGLFLDGMTKMPDFRKFVYKNNVFLESSLEAIKPIL